MTKRTRPQQQKMRLQRRWAELSLRHGLECRDIQWKLKVEPLLLGVKEPTEWFGHLIRMPLHSFLLEVFWVFHLGRSRYRTPRSDYLFNWAWYQFRFLFKTSYYAYMVKGRSQTLLTLLPL